MDDKIKEWLEEMPDWFRWLMKTPSKELERVCEDHNKKEEGEEGE